MKLQIMKKLLLVCLFTIYSLSLFGNENTWFSYWNNSQTLVGFKDINGEIKIEPGYINSMGSITFDDIIIVTEEIDEKYISYYLTKSGKKIHKSIYTYDNSVDIESEGFIRFKDKENDTVGMLDKDGNVVIPSIYNELQKVKNGLVVALKDAKKEYWDQHQESSCNHYSWNGGKIYLIDTNNRILVEDYTYKASYDIFSLIVGSEPSKDPHRVNFLGTNGKYYSLIDYRMEFDDFIKNILTVNLSAENQIKHSYKTLSYRDDELGVMFVSNRELIKKNYLVLKNVLSTLNNNDTDYFISHQQRAPFYNGDKRYEALKFNIEKMEKTTYAHFAIIINQVVNGKNEQDQFYFLKIDDQYKLIDISLGSNKLR